MLLAGAAFFVPHAGKPPSAVPRRTVPVPVTRVVPTPVGVITVSETFQLPPEYAYEGLIQEAADRYSLSPALVRAVIRTESAFDPQAVSSAGAEGLMQLMPALADELGVVDSFDPRENIMAGTRYLSALLGDHGGNLELALASYNAGPGAVERYGGVPPFAETQQYVRTIVGLLGRATPRP
jgi:soluble lytic murein transglycosylase-like protein